jgi:hypothetical protein
MSEYHPPDLATLRARREAHERYLDRNTRFLNLAQLAARWGCSKNTVRAIPITALPYLNMGTGLVREMRRYDPADVAAYEAKRRGG